MIELLFLSLALAMDAFAVSLVRGSVGGGRLIQALEIGIAFGLAQGLMPLLGWGLGIAFAEPFRDYDHWIAFGLLLLLGGRMLMEAWSPDEDDGANGSKLRLFGLITAAFATSIDAAAAGVTLPFLGVTIPVACVTIGVTTGVLCTFGYLIGSRVPRRAGKRAELLGGLVLIGLGTKILIEHLGGYF